MFPRWPLIAFTIVPGAIGVLVFGGYALIDWAALQATYQRYEGLAAQQQGRPTISAALYIAQADQNIHRINLFADGVWTLLSAILVAIGLGALYVGVSRRTTS